MHTISHKATSLFMSMKNQGMAPATASHNKTISLDASHGPIILVQGSDNPWALDLNTLVTIVLGVICIALQASQIYFERARK